MKDSSYANNLLHEEHARRSGDSAIYPFELADVVYGLLDPRRHAPQEVQNLAILELRQLARQICRASYEEQTAKIESEGIYEQQDLFEGLQTRYPANRGGEDAYVLLQDLTEPEGRLCAKRLRTEGMRKIGHADALDAYFDNRSGPGRIGPKGIAPDSGLSGRKAN